MKIDLANEYYGKPKHRPCELRVLIDHYRAQLDGLTGDARSLVRWKIREWKRCIG
jgi:hypothetical protein